MFKLCPKRGLTLWRRVDFTGVIGLAGEGLTPFRTGYGRRVRCLETATCDDLINNSQYVKRLGLTWSSLISSPGGLRHPCRVENGTNPRMLHFIGNVDASGKVSALAFGSNHLVWK